MIEQGVELQRSTGLALDAPGTPRRHVRKVMSMMSWSIPAKLGRAERLHSAIAARKVGVALAPNPVKTKMVYRKDNNRRGFSEHQSFTFLWCPQRPGHAGSPLPHPCQRSLGRRSRLWGNGVRRGRIHLQAGSHLPASIWGVMGIGNRCRSEPGVTYAPRAVRTRTGGLHGSGPEAGGRAFSWSRPGLRWRRCPSVAHRRELTSRRLDRGSDTQGRTYPLRDKFERRDWSS